MAMANDSTNSMGSSAMFDVYIIRFKFLAHFWLFAKWSSFALPSHACSNVEYLLKQCAIYWGSRQSLSRRQYAPNKLCGLNNNVCLITRLYSTLVKKNDHQNNDRLYNTRIQFKVQLKMCQSKKHSSDSTHNTSRWLIQVKVGSFV